MLVTSKVPVVMHLDHGSSFDLAMKAFRAGGYTDPAEATTKHNIL